MPRKVELRKGQGNIHCHSLAWACSCLSGVYVLLLINYFVSTLFLCLVEFFVQDTKTLDIILARAHPLITLAGGEGSKEKKKIF